MLCDASGKELNAATFTKVRCGSANALNFFSITKMIISGWKLTGSMSGLKLSKEDRALIFDVKPPNGFKGF